MDQWKKMIASVRRACALMDVATVLLILAACGTMYFVVRTVWGCAP